MKKILVFGGSGLVGSKFIDLHKSIFEINAPGASKVDILNQDQIAKEVERFNPDSIINFAAFTNVEEAESQRNDQDGICFQINCQGAKNIAEAAKDFDKHLIHISTEYVFDGNNDIAPYIEEDKPNPINWYGQTKLRGEQAVLESEANLIIVRISMPFSTHYKHKKDVARFFLEQLKKGNQVKAVDDQRITPILVDDIAGALKVLLENQSVGIYHISSKDSVTPLEFVNTIAKVFQLDYSLISATTLQEFNKNKKAKLLKYSWLNPTKFEKEFGENILHTVEESLVIFKKGVDSKTSY